MQLIDIILEDENGQLLEKCKINFNDVYSEYQNLKNVNLFFLSTVDPVGNTMFNRLQVPKVIAEMQELRAMVNKKISNDIDEVVLFLKKIENEVHTYIKFVGD